MSSTQKEIKSIELFRRNIKELKAINTFLATKNNMQERELRKYRHNLRARTKSLKQKFIYELLNGCETNWHIERLDFTHLQLAGFYCKFVDYDNKNIPLLPVLTGGRSETYKLTKDVYITFSDYNDGKINLDIRNRIMSNKLLKEIIKETGIKVAWLDSIKLGIKE